MGIIEAKREDEGHRLTVVEEQSKNYADAKCILFLVDTRNLGEEAEQEFMTFLPNDDNRKFTELYNVQLLTSSNIAEDSQVCFYLDNLPDPDVLASEIIENIEAGLNSFKEIMETINGEEDTFN